MTSLDIDTAPLSRLATGLDGISDALADTDPLLKQAAAEVTRLAAPRTPRRTGRLAGSVSSTTDAGRAGVRWGVGYAVFVNFGTRYMRAQPFATDALADAESTVERLAVEWAEQAVS